MIKKRISVVIAAVGLLLVMLFGACSLKDENAEGEMEKEIEFDSSLLQFGKSNTVVDETVIFKKGKTGEVSVKLLFVPTRIVSMKRYYNPASTGIATFFQDIDFSVNGNVLSAIGERMPYVTEDMLSGADTTSWTGVDYSQIPSVESGKFNPFTEGSQIVAMQIAVTYEYDNTEYDGTTIAIENEKLAKTLSKLRNKESVEMFFYGDSVATGANSSGVLKIEPHLPIWSELVGRNLQAHFKGRVNVVNKAVGGWRSTEGLKGGTGWVNGVQISQQGLKWMLEDMKDYSPDVAVFHFGLNDGAKHIAITREEYRENMFDMVYELRKKNLDCEIILINPHRANPNAPNHATGLQQKFAYDLRYISEQEQNVSYLDMGGIHDYILKTKKYIDTSSNNVNHPNDFMTRVYASSILGMFL